MKIAVLYTCFNRREKTLSSLHGLFSSIASYNHDAQDHLETEIFLTDDGCTDGTAEAIKAAFPQKNIHILQGTGSLYWAGGMRKAWSEAQKRHQEWDFYLLLNDDTNIFPTSIHTLMLTHQYCQSEYGKPGIYSGITCDPTDENITTYGGRILTNQFLGSAYKVKASGQPQLVDQANANIMLVPATIVDKLGILYEGYHHGNADFDYTMQARRNGIPVLVTAHNCGSCRFDHSYGASLKQKILDMSAEERKHYFENPLHSSKDYLTFIRRNTPIKYPFTWIFRMLQEKYPKIYYAIKRQ